jgi:hypothetical protein
MSRKEWTTPKSKGTDAGRVADSLNEAKAAFRAERPLSPEKADEKCST